MSFRIGEIVGDYTILEELGSGGSGRVFKVEHNITRRKEAMKVLAGTTQTVRDTFLRFLQEIRLQAALAHPGIAEVHNAFWTGDHLVMVMELVEGDSLESLVAAGRLPLEESVSIIQQVLAALSHAHAQRVVHRDVSPSNIFVTRDRRVKLTDFGLAAMTEDLRSTQNGAFLGSFHYMSPEQVRAIGPVDARSDIYSCGVVLYEMVTGRKPFNYDNAFSLMQAHVEQTPLPPVSINPNIPAGLSEAILKAMEKDPANRFASAAAFRDALEALDAFALCLATAGLSDDRAPELQPVGDDEITTAPSSRDVREFRAIPERRYLRAAIAAVLGVLLALAAGVASLSRLRKAQDGPPAAEGAVTPVMNPSGLPVVPPPPPPPMSVPPPPYSAATPQAQPMPRIRATAESKPTERRRTDPADRDASSAAPPLPVAVPPPTPFAAPDPTPLIEAPPLIAAPGVSSVPGPPVDAVVVPTPPPPPPSEKAEPARPRGVRGFFGRILNPGRRKPGEKTPETSEGQPASKP
jgi:serine/threonine-protein kinase